MVISMSAGKSVFLGSNTQLRARQSSVPVCRAPLVVRAQQEQQSVARRSALGLLAGAAALLTRTGPSEAAFGDAANVFGKATNTTGFVPYQGEGFALLIPSKWNPSREQEFPNTTLRYEDNGDSVNNFSVLVKGVGKNSIADFGDPKEFLGQINYLFGDQVFSGALLDLFPMDKTLSIKRENYIACDTVVALLAKADEKQHTMWQLGQTQSEGGFKANKVSAISVLDYGPKEKDGKTYYTYELLSRTADGDEGGRHQLISATVNGGKLYLLKVQAGDKRWFKGAEKFCKGTWNSFKVA